jgi:hypothetical protein
MLYMLWYLIWPLVVIIWWGKIAWEPKASQDAVVFESALAFLWPVALFVALLLAPFLLLDAAGRRHRRGAEARK